MWYIITRLFSEVMFEIMSTATTFIIVLWLYTNNLSWHNAYKNTVLWDFFGTHLFSRRKLYSQNSRLFIVRENFVFWEHNSRDWMSHRRSQLIQYGHPTIPIISVPGFLLFACLEMLEKLPEVVLGLIFLNWARGKRKRLKNTSETCSTNEVLATWT